MLNTLATSYNLDNDPALGEPKKRRMPPQSLTAERTSVQRSGASLPRSSGRSGSAATAVTTEQPRCEFGNCEKPYAHYCHLKPHALGSGREVKDLVHGCRVHHKFYDAGLIRHIGWTKDGRPVFYDEVRRDFMPVKPLPGDRGDLEMPEWLLKTLSKRLRRRYERRKKVRDAMREAEEAKEAAKADPRPQGPKELEGPPRLGDQRKPAKPLRPRPRPPSAGQVRGRAPSCRASRDPGSASPAKREAEP